MRARAPAFHSRLVWRVGERAMRIARLRVGVLSRDCVRGYTYV